MIFPKFSIGDLVRTKSLVRSEEQRSGYGIIVDIMPSNMKCLWDDGETVWIEPKQLYLIARGQGGTKS